MNHLFLGDKILLFLLIGGFIIFLFTLNVNMLFAEPGLRWTRAVLAQKLHALAIVQRWGRTWDVLVGFRLLSGADKATRRWSEGLVMGDSRAVALTLIFGVDNMSLWMRFFQLVGAATSSKDTPFTAASTESAKDSKYWMQTFSFKRAILWWIVERGYGPTGEPATIPTGLIMYNSLFIFMLTVRWKTHEMAGRWSSR